LRRLDGDLGDSGDVAAVLDGRGEKFAQPADQHDRELAGRRTDAGRAQFRGAGQRLDQGDERFDEVALQVAGVLAERGEIASRTCASHGALGSTAAAICLISAALASHSRAMKQACLLVKCS
jgi:hypothetical protein